MAHQYVNPLRLSSNHIWKMRFPLEWYKANVAPVHKKNNFLQTTDQSPHFRYVKKYLDVCYIMIPLLFSLQSTLFSQITQAWNLDSCINQLLSITHEMCASFDERYEDWGVFHTKSKAFDKVWHEGFIITLKQNGICGKMLRVMKDIVIDRKEDVVLTRHCSIVYMSEQEFFKPHYLDPYSF